MNIILVTPARPSARAGNWHTAARWARLLREAGHRVRTVSAWDGDAGPRADLMLALHARRSADSIRRWSIAMPRRPLIVALTGTDLYRDIRTSRAAQRSLALADRLLVLQALGAQAVPARHRGKTRVIYQSAPGVRPGRPREDAFEVCVSGHLRAEKDPFRTAAALAYLPKASRIRVVHAGAAYAPAAARQAQAWADREPRYRWLGELSHRRALTLLTRSRLLVMSSRLEGGANVVSEALVAGVPVLASRIPGNVGMLGRDYAGYYPVENTHALARLLRRAEADPAFYRKLMAQCRLRRRLITPVRERAALAAVVKELRASG
ncbi:MAG: selenoneine biosynthesis selenosugar synthase SenB [Burkholderiales bacterium]